MNSLEAVLDRPEPAMAAVVAEELDDPTVERISEISDVVEVRADLLPSQETGYLEDQIHRFGSVPVLLTIRSKDEGGEWARSEDERLDLFSELSSFVNGVDVELASPVLDSFVQEAHSKDKVVLGSSHEFERMPSNSELLERLAGSIAAEVDYTKFAVLTETSEDYDELEAFLEENASKKLIVVGMGKMGPKSRINFPGQGSHLTYAFTGESVAPGQLDFEKTHAVLKQMYPDYARLFD